jgi:hypothetical protein
MLVVVQPYVPLHMQVKMKAIEQEPVNCNQVVLQNADTPTFVHKQVRTLLLLFEISAISIAMKCCGNVATHGYRDLPTSAQDTHALAKKSILIHTHLSVFAALLPRCFESL